ncbi:CHASE domain-containing protein [Simiduia curdlanivorans]|uniref:histidine kinase n=1 Tax=Simiduia curdlanivorans TaxID=1492769 RepID=A0ABV8V9J1_9GAMM|nr:CHASE domain-containing protein [Simiduia curdlanivorans]MDN3638742.1 CHASE domain-containing protein [Simiduia curdlanivorans]
MAYFIAGKYGLVLAIPPGFASAVWPASGVALAAMLLYPRVFTSIGIGLGSFALNLGVVAGGYQGITVDMLTLPASIALGASLQAYVGYWLFTRLLTNTLFDSPVSIIRFTLVVCPISCLVAASVGTGSLSSLGVIDATNITFTWLTWWAGDTIGTLLFAPMLIVLCSRQKRFTRIRKWQIAVPTAAIFLGITLLFYLSTVNQTEIAQRNIADAARTFGQSLNERLSISKNKLLAYNAFFNSSQVITAADFESFSTYILEDDDVFQGIGWTPIVSADKRHLFEKLAQEDISPDFVFRDLNSEGALVKSPEQSTYYPVFFIYPLASNKRALGLNLSSLPQRLPLLLRANATGEPLATAPITLVQGSREQKAIILYLPIFSATPLSATNPSIAAVGFISGVFQMNGLLDTLVEQLTEKKYGASIVDITNSDSSITLYQTPRPQLFGLEPNTIPLAFGGRKLEVTVYADVEYKLGSKDWTSWSILTFGFLLAALFQAFILLITGTTENIKSEVDRQTLELNKAKISAEKANRAKTNFLNNMSHELRTPLNAVMGFIALTLKTPTSEIQRSHLNKAQLASSTLMSLINHTLDYSKIESGRIELENISFSLTHIIDKLAAIFSHQAEEKGIFFQLSLDKRIPSKLIGDPLRLEQILINLCNNAIKFTSSGGVTLKVTNEEVDDQHLALEFKVIDSGIGIEADQQEKIFSAFSQAETGIERLYGGTGLGLAICKKLVETMDGTISLKSQVNVGTQIAVQLCFKIGDTDHNEAQKITSDDPPNNTLMAGIRILLVEDIPTNQELATYILEDFGAKVFVAENGLAAIEFLKENNEIDLILMDLQMPVMDGIEATKRIIADPNTNHIPIIAMTANAISTDVDACLEAGMLDHIAKPIDEADLAKKVMKHCKLDGKQA